MPFLEPIDERYWCPVFWPPWKFDPLRMCTRTVNKWCYYFDYYKADAVGLWQNVTACEGFKKYSWTEGPGLYFENVVAGSPGQPYKVCFDSMKGQTGKCVENFGSSSGGLTPDTGPFVGSSTLDVKELSQQVVETGVTTFTLENSHPCRVGDWPWERVRHSQEMTVRLNFGQVDIAWSLDGYPLSSTAGTIQIPTVSSWPEPVPANKKWGWALTMHLSEVKYAIDTSLPGVAVLKLWNRPADGVFDVDIGFTATLNGAHYYAKSIQARFEGESIRFDAKQLEAEQHCLDKFDLKDDSGHPRPWDPVIAVEYVREIAGRARMEVASYLLARMDRAFGRDANAYKIFAGRLIEEIGAVGMLRAIGGRLRSSFRRPSSGGCGCK
jgi:hypothetical protein